VKSIKKNILSLVLFLPFAFWAQGPGYIGKKSVTGYGLEYSPAFSGATVGLPFNLTQQIYFEHALETELSGGVSLRYALTKYDNGAEVLKLGRPTSDYTIHALSVSPYLKFFSKKYVAPWGKYWVLGFVGNAIITKHDPFMYNTQSLATHDTLLMDFGPEKQLHKSVDILIGKGKSRIIRNKIVLDYGFNVQLVSLLKAAGSDFKNMGQDSYIEKTAIDRVRGLNRFNLFLKLGYLF